MKKVIFAAVAVCCLCHNTWGMDVPVPIEMQSKESIGTEIKTIVEKDGVASLSDKKLIELSHWSGYIKTFLADYYVLKIQQEIVRRDIAEICGLSRFVTTSTTKKFCRALGLPEDTQVYVMDANSYIWGLKGLTEEQKIRYEELRLNDEELLKEFASKASFETPELEEKITASITPYTDKSQIFRDAIACYLARVAAEPFLHDRFERVKAIRAFKSGDKSRYRDCSGEILLSFEPSVINTWPCVYENQLWKLPTGVAISTLAAGRTVYHEVGHHRHFMDLQNLFIKADGDNMFYDGGQLYTGFTEISVNKEAFFEWIDSARRKGGEYANFQLEALLHNGADGEKVVLTASDFDDGDTSEFFQIMGVAAIKSAGKTYLFINDMSDIHLSAELGLPIRIDHNGIFLNTLTQAAAGKEYQIMNPNFKGTKTLGSCINALNIQYLLPIQDNPNRWMVSSDSKTPVKFAANLDAYGPLLEIFGTSIYEYWSKMMYPYGLLSTLSFEGKLYAVNYELLGKMMVLPSKLILKHKTSDELSSPRPTKRIRLMKNEEQR